VTESHLEDIADAIRDANGGSATYKPGQMAAAVTALKKTLVSKTITENGNYNPASDSADGYSSVTVNVSGGGGGIVFPGDTDIVQTIYTGGVTTVSLSKKGYYIIVAAMDGSSSSSVSYSVSGGATLVKQDVKSENQSSWGGRAFCGVIYSDNSGGVTVSCTSLSRSAMIVLYVTDVASSFSDILLACGKDNAASVSVNSVSKDYCFFAAGTTGDNNPSATITTENTKKMDKSFTNPSKIHKYGVCEGSGAVTASASGTSYATNYGVIVEFS